MSIIYFTLIFAIHKFGFSSSKFTCQNGNGLYSHPTDCKLFYNCWEGRAWLQKCNEHLFFNQKKQICDYLENINCRLKISTACGENQPIILKNRKGRIWNSRNEFGHYNPNLICSWIISAPVGQFISLKFEKLNLENSRSCHKDRIDVFDGTFDNGKLVKTFCGTAVNLPGLVSSGNQLFIRFTSDSSVNEYEGFSLAYEFNHQPKRNGNPILNIADSTRIACGENKPAVLNRPEGKIMSPGLNLSDIEGSKYPSWARCEWRISAPQNMFIQINFSVFNIEKTHGCGIDALVINEGSTFGPPYLSLLCGYRLPAVIKSTGNELHLLFVSDQVREFNGFLLDYKLIPDANRCSASELVCGKKKCVTNGWRCDGYDDCSDETDEMECVTSLQSEWRKCGKPEYPFGVGSFIQTRIVGGRDADIGNWPWQAALFLGDRNVNEFQCGGTIVHSNWIVTAAHCFKNEKNPLMWIVFVGKHDISLPESTEQLREIDKIILHPEFSFELNSNSVHGKNDIALLRLKRSLEFTDYVIPVCLPPPQVDLVVAGTKLHVTGFGLTNGTGDENLLRHVELPIRSEEDCQKMYPIKYPKGENNVMFCASLHLGGHDSCHGDSGGPAVINISDGWHLLGVVAWGEGCGNSEKAGVYTKVSHFIPWIKKMTNVTFDEQFDEYSGLN